MMPVTLQANETALIRFRAPAVATDNTTRADLRYWSLSLGYEQSHTLITRYHDELKTDKGVVYLAIASGEPDAQLPSHWNYVRWPTNTPLMLVYRYIMPSSDFSDRIQKAPALPIKKLDPRQHAGLSMGDYSPSGQVVNKPLQRDDYIKWQESSFLLLSRQ